MPNSHWYLLEDQELKDFHQDWWGESGRKRLDDAISTKILRIRRPTVCLWFGLLGITSGALYVRDEVLQTYDDLARVYEFQRNQNLLNGVLLTGQPGLGKTADIMHIITKRMSLEQNTLYTSSCNEVFRISEEGIERFSKPADSIMYTDLKSFDLSSHPWSIIDAGWSSWAARPTPSLTQHPLFSIYVTPPNVTRYWRKMQEPTVYVMQPWHWEGDDLLQCMKLIGTNMDNHTIADIQYHCGPLPRDIWSYVRDPRAFKNRVKAAAALLKANNLDAMLTRMLPSTFTADFDFDNLFIMRRTSRDSTYFRSDKHEVDFKSPFAEQHLRRRFVDLVLPNSKRLFYVCHLAPEVSVFGGWIFEAQAMKYTAGQIDNQGAFGPFKKMEGDGRRFTDTTLSTATYRAEKDERGAMKYFDGPSVVHRYTPSDSESPMYRMEDRRPGLFCKREFLHHTEIDSVAIRPECYYVPMLSNNPLFDAFFFDDSDNQFLFIYFLQMAIAKRDNGRTESGLQLVQTLKQRVELEEFVKGREIKVRYLLVAPAREHAVSWVMPEEWDDSRYLDVKDDVYIQYIDLKVMKEY